ncbi:choice-of-anchor D domain-containing protein [Flavobacterium sp.]|uniref:choice-of-anchor D domain-containing protein n=1 Tax=Flavobacterium sp. TaxID=239 RepID=UPI003753020D
MKNRLFFKNILYLVFIFLLNFTAQAQTPEMNVVGNGVSIADNDTSPSINDWTDFGLSTLGINVSYTFTIQNTGTGVLNLGAISFTGVNATEYSVTTAPSATVAAGGSTTFVIKLSPLSVGIKTATFSIVNNDGNENPYNFNLSGVGVNPEIDILGNLNSIIDGNTIPSLTNFTDFGTTNTGVAIARTFTLQNNGTGNLSVGAITFSGANASEFTITTLPLNIVANATSTTFVVTFNPIGTGLRTAAISIVNNDSNENPYNFSIQGNAINPEINILGNAISIVDGDNSPTLTDWTEFGSTSIGFPITRTFTIQNTGITNLNIGAITFSGANASDYTVTVLPSSIILPGGFTTFTVAFSPLIVQGSAAILSIANNDSNENPYDFELKATGVSPEINFQGNLNNIADADTSPVITDWTDFGSTNTGTTITRTFTIQNTSNFPLSIGAITFTGINATDFIVTTLPSASIAALSNTTFVVSFTPSAIGLRTATISIVNNDSNENPYDFSIQGTGLAPEINLLGNAISIVDADAIPSIIDWTDFTSSAIGVAVTRTFTIQNTGTATLNIGAISFSGTNVSEFTVTSLPASTVLSGSSTTFIVSFNPTASGVRTATLSIVNNDSNENPYDFAIQGTGIESEINIQGNAINIIDGDTTPITTDWTDFGSSNVNTATTRTYTIQNTGTAALSIGAITFSGLNATDFTITTLPTPSVAVNSSTTFVVSFNPSALGIRTASISIVNNDANENPYNFTIQGNGILPEINIQGNAITILDGDSTPSITDLSDFGSSNIGTATTKTFTIQNLGTADLTIGAITFLGTNAAEFTITNIPNTTVIAGGTTTFTVSFNPSSLGLRTATISIVTNDANENPYNFSIQGTGNTPEINVLGNSISITNGDLTPTTIDFTDLGSTNVGTTISQTFTIQNIGNSSLTIGALSFSGINASDFTISTLPSSLILAGATTTFTVAFNPSLNVIRTATLNIINNDLDENPYSFSIQGLGIAPEIDIQGNALSIIDGDTTPIATDWTNFETLSTRTFTIFNTGNQSMNIGTISISGANASEFSIATLPSSTVAAGASTTFIVKFSPTSLGLKNAIISVINNDANENPYDFAIAATGIIQEIDIKGNAITIATGDTSPVTTDWTDYSTVTNSRTFTIFNTGTVPLNLGAISITGLNASEFTITSSPTPIVAGNSFTIITVTFIPISNGVKNATLSIANNDSNENPYTFAIRATANLPLMNIKGNNTLITDGDITPSLLDRTDFNITNISSVITRTYSIENLGTMNLNLTGTPLVSVIGSPEFTVLVVPSSTITGNNTTSFVIRFNPLTIGIYTADISIANNDPLAGKNPYTFRITGQAVQVFTDSDGDTVFNNVDSDDDNDGIPDNIEQSYNSGSLITNKVDVPILNETFGAGQTRSFINANVPTASTTYCYEEGTTFPETCSLYPTSAAINDGEYVVNYIAGVAPNNVSFATWYQGLDHTPSDVDGKMAIFNASNSLTEEFYRTTLQGVIPNASLKYSFWVINLIKSDAPGASLTTKPDITVEFKDSNNVLLNTITTGLIPVTNAASVPNGDWYNFTATFIPTTSDINVVFRNNQPGGNGNDLAIDDILITQSLNDTDQDGMADVLDLDCDNDGIGDIIEDGWELYSNGKDTNDLLASTWVDFNGNGWNDASEAYYATSLPKNYDNDSVPNYIDLDSDNDAIFDVDEAGLLNGDGDVNGDGLGEGTDIDKDGILSSFDAYIGFGNTAKPLPINTLASDNYDFIKLSSKNNGAFDIIKTLYANLDTDLDGKVDTTTDIDKDGLIDLFDTNTNYFGSPRNIDKKLYLDFDGRNDYGEAAPVIGGLSSASIMAWIDLSSDFNSTGVIFGQDKFQIRVNASNNLEVIVKNITLTHNTVSLNKKQWYHVAATYGSGSVKLYLNGLLVATQSVSGSISADASSLTIGKNPTANNNYFKGKIDEARLFNVELTEQQLQRMVYQEIVNFGGEVRGEIIPKNIETLPYANLLRYYRMDVYKNDIIDDLTTAGFDTTTGLKIYNNKVIWYQEAPMPFITVREGDFAKATDNAIKDIKGMDIIDYDWSIVHVKHDITEFSNNTDLGMLVDAGKTINLNNDNKIQNNWYLKLDGKIDLNGKSQLIQTINSDLDPTSAGFIERDQKGQSNLFNYNYWSSPVGAINTTTNNNSYSVGNVMKDGTTSTPHNITWTSGYNGSPTSPITLSSYWIYKFQNLSGVYANWQSVGISGLLNAGQGYTLKGSGGLEANQNLTFVGKPNNGFITNPIAPNNLNLSGNPYTSSIDATQFILDNTTSTTGTLYFWEHSPTNNTHVTAGYKGGYAARNLTGGVAPIAPLGIAGVGTSAKIPGRYVPVSQGFFVYGSTTGGTITFNNNQRLFIKENDIDSNELFKNNNLANNTIPLAQVYNNSNDEKPEDEFKKIRLGFKSTDNYYKQALLGFMENNATENIDYGYDSVIIENSVNDMYFINNDKNLNIQGVGYFNENNTYPLGVKNNVAGDVIFRIEEIQNFDINFDAYIFDNVTNTYHDIKNSDFTISLPQGVTNNRFSLRFLDQNALATENFNSAEGIQIVYTSSNSILNIKNNVTDTIVETATLFNILGQSVASWNVKDQSQQNILLPIKNLTSGTYIVKVKTEKGFTSRKVIIN